MTTSPRVFIARRIPDRGLDHILQSLDADVWEGPLPPSREALLERVAGVDGILALLTDRIDDDVLEVAGERLKVVSNFAVGVDNVDLVAATRRSVAVGNTPGVLTETTADLAFALLMAAARHVVAGDRYVRGGHWRTWEPQLLLGMDLHGATLGIVGFGRIGQAVARRAAGFDMEVLYSHPRKVETDVGEWVALPELLARSDFVTLHTPLTTATRHLIDADALEQMKRGSVLVNTARGAIVEPRALFQALQSGHLASAALDVTDPEPIDTNDPLLTLDNLIVVPHIGSASIATRNRMAEMAAANLLAGVRGERLPHCANPEIYL